MDIGEPNHSDARSASFSDLRSNVRNRLFIWITIFRAYAQELDDSNTVQVNYIKLKGSGGIYSHIGLPAYSIQILFCIVGAD